MIEKSGGQYLITQRPAKATLPLLWEFPGGRVEENESDEEALARELEEEMGIGVRVLEQTVHMHHEYPGYDIDFRVYRCKMISPESEIRHLRVNDHRWVTLAELGNYKFPDADAKTIAKLLGLDA